MASKEEIEQFLKEFKYKLGFRELIIRLDRGKNAETLAELEFTTNKVKTILKELKVENYSQGPEVDTLYKNQDMWIFGKQIKGKEVYIKITLGQPNSEVICISFHFSERPMKYPLN